MVELVTPPTGQLLTTLTAVKQELLVPSADTSADDFLSQLLREATETVFEWAGRPLYRAQFRESRRGSEGESLALSRYPVASVESVLADGTAVTDFSVLKGNGLLVRPSGFASGASIPSIEWVVLYTAGYFLPDDDLAGTYSVATSDDSYNDAASGFHPLLRAGDTVLAAEFVDASNNGLKVVASATTSKIVATSNLVTATAEAAKIQLRNLPGWIERAAIDLVRLGYHGRDRDPALSSLTVGPASASFDPEKRLTAIRRRVESLSLAS